MKHNATRLTICLAALLAAVMATKPTDVRAAAFFTSEAQFEAALGQERPYMESFETRFENGPSIDSVPGVTMVALTTMPEGILSLGLDHDPRALPTHAQRTIGLITSFAGGGLRFEFDTPIDAFAIDIIGALNSGYGNQSLTMTTSNGDSRVILTGLHPPDGIRFGGVIDDTTPFTSVTIFDSLGGDGVQFDRLRFRPIGGAEERISRAAYPLLAERVNENRENFFVYRDADSGFNHGFPSGFFGAVDKISIEADCVDDVASTDGCASDPDVLDLGRVNVLRVTFDPLAPGEFAGINFEEPENWGVTRSGMGYDLTGATHLEFDLRSPTGAHVQFGVAGKTTGFFRIPAGTDYARASIALSTMGVTPDDLADAHILFSVATNSFAVPNGGTILLDNIQLTPTPGSQAAMLGFPLGTQSFGVVPRQEPPFPSDQVIRNLTTIYESALTMLALFDRGQAEDIDQGCLIAETFQYALHNDNQGDPLPVAPDGSRGLHNGYESGDIALFNGQGPGAGQKGQVRLPGFSASTCGSSGFCLVLDGATGGNNTFAMLGLLEAHRQCAKPGYLDDARTIGNWIAGNLTDTTGTGFGGYYLGYPDEGVVPKTLMRGKSIENNADIFHAFWSLSKAVADPVEAATWIERANIAGDFVMDMYDSDRGCFFAGTVPVGTPPGPGIEPTGPRMGDDVVNIADFLDSNSFTTLALAGSPRYRERIDWRRPVQCVLDNFAQTITTESETFEGFNIVAAPTAGANGIAWEFTGQVVVLLRLVDDLYQETRFEAVADFYLDELQRALERAPFGDARGLVASTLENGADLRPIDQCLSTPFQCIPQRVGLAATTWAVFAERNVNPLGAEEAVADDFNGDGKSDFLWRNTATGSAVIWQMDGFMMEDVGGIGAPPLVWQVAGIADFSADTEADILWRNTTTGGAAIWLMDGFTRRAAAYIGAPDLDWQVVGTGDFDGDRRADILWRNIRTGAVVIWEMHGLLRAAIGGIVEVPLVWQVAGLGDFNADAKWDILWRNTRTGSVVVWLMDGLGRISAGGIGSAPLVWQVLDIGDFNGDRRADILWRHASSGNTVIWQMRGLTRDAVASIGAPPLVWRVEGVGDTDGDHRSDITWRSTATGSVVVWKMDGFIRDDAGGIGGAPLVWEMQ